MSGGIGWGRGNVEGITRHLGELELKHHVSLKLIMIEFLHSAGKSLYYLLGRLGVPLNMGRVFAFDDGLASQEGSPRRR